MIKTGIDHNKILYLDIETVPIVHDFFELPTAMAIAWNSIHEIRYATEKDASGELISAAASFKKYAALFPEFAKIVCISLGYFKTETEFSVRAYYGTNEKELLVNVGSAITKASSQFKVLGGHNIKSFDIPFMIRRSTILDINLPPVFDLWGEKPWDLDSFLDTMEVWKCTALYLGSSSLESIAAAFGFKNPKEDMSGEMVSTLYYLPTGPDFSKIGKYCNNDVVVSACVYVRMTKGDGVLKTIKIAENIV